jgi:hypothetical protein
MTFNLKLDTLSIQSIVRKLRDSKEELEQSVADFVDTMLTDGAMVANSHYGNMATAWGKRDTEQDGLVEGHIGVSGVNDEVVYIAEFGAGDATLPVMFENYPGVDVYAGAYSEQLGTGEYAATGKWHWQNAVFTEIPPRAGLLNAKNYLLEEGNNAAQEMIHL